MPTRAKVALSGYRSRLYDRLYSDWNVTEIPASTCQSGAKQDRVEIVWTNYEPHRTLFGVIA